MLRTIFVLMIMVPGFFMALKNRFAALLMYIWYASFRPEEWMWFDVSSLRLSLVFGLILVVPSLLSGWLPNLTHPLSLGALAFLGSALVSQINAVVPAIGWAWLDFMARLIIVCLLLTTLVNTRHRFILTVAVLAMSYGFHSSKAGVIFFLTGARFHDGLSGAYIDNNGYALAIVMVTPLLLATAQNIRSGLWNSARYERLVPWLRRGFFISVVLSAGTVIGTFSRSGLIGLGASVFVFIMFQRKRLGPLIALTSVLALAYLFMPAPEGYLERIETISTYEEVNETSALSRLHFWAVARDIAAANPFGIGLRQFDSVYDQYDYSDGFYGRRRSVHSSHFQTLAEQGYPGAAIWTFLFIYSMVLGFRIRKRSKHPALAPDVGLFMVTYANGMMASMAGFVVGGAFIALAVNDITWYSFALLAALDLISKRQLADALRDAEQRPVESPARSPQSAVA